MIWFVAEGMFYTLIKWEVNMKHKKNGIYIYNGVGLLVLALVELLMFLIKKSQYERLLAAVIILGLTELIALGSYLYEMKREERNAKRDSIAG